MRVGNELVGEIGQGLLVLLGVARGDSSKQAERLAGKVGRMRLFEQDGRMERSLLDVDGAALCVSQFTLYGDARKGTRPSYSEAATPEHAEPLYEYFCEQLAQLGVPVERGRFGAMMQVELVNDGPVTLILEV